jgi:hypothetical protein
LTANFAFGISQTLLQTAKALWKPQNTGGTVWELFAPFKINVKGQKPVNTGVGFS